MSLDFIKNKEPKIIIAYDPEQLPVETRNYEYRCKFCGAFNSGMANFHEEVHSTADIVELGQDEPELENFNDYEPENFIIDSFRCTECGEERDNIQDIFEDFIAEAR